MTFVNVYLSVAFYLSDLKQHCNCYKPTGNLPPGVRFIRPLLGHKKKSCKTVDCPLLQYCTKQLLSIASSQYDRVFPSGGSDSVRYCRIMLTQRFSYCAWPIQFHHMELWTDANGTLLNGEVLVPSLQSSSLSKNDAKSRDDDFRLELINSLKGSQSQQHRILTSNKCLHTGLYGVVIFEVSGSNPGPNPNHRKLIFQYCLSFGCLCYFVYNIHNIN